MTIRSPLAVIGGGRMGEAILSGLLAAGYLAPSEILVAEPDDARRAELESAHGVRCVAGARVAVSGAGTVLVAVKPQVFDEVVTSLADGLEPGALVVSIAAGITTARVESLLPIGSPVVRVMPNAPAMVRRGMSLVSAGAEATCAQVEDVAGMFSALGDAVVIDERYQDAGTAISGCGPAYVAVFVDALARAGVREGLSREVAQRLALQTMRGTVELIESTGQHPAQVVDAVSSPGGSTVAAIAELEATGFSAAVFAAVRAAARRSKELGA